MVILQFSYSFNIKLAFKNNAKISRNPQTAMLSFLQCFLRCAVWAMSSAHLSFSSPHLLPHRSQQLFVHFRSFLLFNSSPRCVSRPSGRRHCSPTTLPWGRLTVQRQARPGARVDGDKVHASVIFYFEKCVWLSHGWLDVSRVPLRGPDLRGVAWRGMVGGARN